MRINKQLSVTVRKCLLCSGLAIILSSCAGPSLDLDFDYDPDYKVKGQEKYPSDLSSGKVYGTVEVDEKTRQVKGYITTDEGDTKGVKGYIDEDGEIHVHDSDWTTYKLKKKE